MIDIDLEKALRQPGADFDFSWSGDPGYGQLDLAGPLKVTGRLCVNGRGVRVRGTVKGAIRQPCSRCLREVVLAADADFDEMFTDQPGVEDDVYVYNRETKRISLDQMIYDILSVDIPLQVLCSDKCRGLCPKCGHNLNEGPCACVPEDDHESSPNNPFAALKDLF